MLSPSEIKQKRESLNVSQSVICKLTEISQPYISALENGLIKNPRPITLEKIKIALNSIETNQSKGE